MTLRTDVSALYVDPRGPYPKRLEDWWDEKRDARDYSGPNPVVAHPPCGPWGRLKFLCRHQDANLGPVAVYQVRGWGGVLEHPEHSSLWKACGLPRPGEPADDWGGRTVRVDQVNYGHRAQKKTWIYFVGVSLGLAQSGALTGGKPTHRVTNGSRGDTSLPRIGSLEARLSPVTFAEWLIELAASARKST